MAREIITRIKYNRTQSGKTFQMASVGYKGCISITEHRPLFEGDKFYYDIKYNNGETIRTFNPNEIVLTEK